MSETNWKKRAISNPRLLILIGGCKYSYINFMNRGCTIVITRNQGGTEENKEWPTFLYNTSMWGVCNGYERYKGRFHPSYSIT